MAVCLNRINAQSSGHSAAPRKRWSLQRSSAWFHPVASTKLSSPEFDDCSQGQHVHRSSHEQVRLGTTLGRSHRWGQPPGGAAGAKRKKRRRRTFAAQEKPELPTQEAACDSLTAWAVQRLKDAWAAEAKAASLSPLEMREVKPLKAWFAPCPPGATVASLPQSITPSTEAGSVLRELIKGKICDKAGKGAAILVLCSSVERVFAVIAELQTSWKVKPTALANHGGGRKRDQLARQAVAFGSARVAVGVPGRVIRLLDEKLLDAGALESLELVILDLAIDPKQRDLLSLADTRRDLLDLFRRFLAPAFARGARLRLAMCCAGQHLRDKPPVKSSK